MTLRTLAIPVKVLFSCFLLTIGLGYLFAILYLFLMDIEPHSGRGIGMVEAVIVKYYGQRGTTRLEAAIDGAMGENLSTAQKNELKDWLRRGATEAGYAAVEPILREQCAGCHSPESGMPIPPLTRFEEAAAYATTDLGQSVKILVRVSHIHLFGMSFIFLLTGGIFALSELNLRWRAALIATPFLSIWLDIGSWWFTKLQPLFAYTVIVGGALMGASLAGQILISLREMWLKKEP